ncbi:MAG: DUF2817 domain-containing protein [Rhodospirillaceae bacterium]
MATGRAAASRRSLSDYFSPDYASARDRFREAARSAGAQLEALAIAASGPNGETLTTDIAWLGAPHARHVVVHTSGIHGVEAFTGSAVQLALLHEAPRVGRDCALALVHVLNPYGMAWLRRVNENNVDLNRNFLGEDESWSGASPLYATLDPLLNPATPPRRDAFVARAVLRLVRHGYRAVKQAVAQGQYDFPQGLFFGGAGLEEGPRRYIEWLTQRLQHARRVLALDVHTGLGPWGEDTLLTEPGYRAPAGLADALGRPLVDPSSGERTSYVVKGGLASGVRRALPDVELHALVQEFGTYPILRVISALRDENRAHFHGQGGVSHPAKQALLRVLCPEDPRWRDGAVARGVLTARGAIDWLQRRQE